MSVPHSYSLRSLAMAVWLACAGSAGAQTSPPASADASAGVAVPMRIPAGPLSDTLTRIGQLTSHAIAADPDLLTGLSAPAVSGNLTALEAVHQALAGSGLEAVPLSGKALTIRRSPVVPGASDADTPMPAQALEAVTVTTERLSSKLMNPTYSYTVIDGEEYGELKAMSPNVMTMLSKAVPGLSDSSRNLTDFGQTLRGLRARATWWTTSSICPIGV